MRPSTPFALPLAALIALGACSPAADEAPAAAEASLAGQDAAGQQAAAQETIQIGLSADGAITVSPDSLGINRGRSPVVAWSASAEIGDRTWMVAFGSGSPFRNGQTVFSSNPGRDRAPINAEAAGDTYKYSVFVADEEGNWIDLDPKIVIIDDPGTLGDTTAGGGGGL